MAKFWNNFGFFGRHHPPPRAKKGGLLWHSCFGLGVSVIVSVSVHGI